MRRRISAILTPVALIALIAVAAPPVAQAAPASPPDAEVVHSAVFPDATDTALSDVRVSVAASTTKSLVTLGRSGQILQSRRVPSAGGLVVFEAEGLAEGRYDIAVTQGASVTTLRVAIYRGWAPIDPDQPSWQRCRTITWAYDARRAPSGGDRSMLKDITTVLADLTEATGLRFRRAATGAVMTFAWGSTGGADGVGGLKWTDGPGTVTSGTITLSPSSSWAKTPGPSERQVLLLHETAHAIGLGHVANTRSLMSPTYRPGLSRATLGAGELRALRTIYRPTTCR